MNSDQKTMSIIVFPHPVPNEVSEYQFSLMNPAHDGYMHSDTLQSFECRKHLEESSELVQLLLAAQAHVC